MTKLSVNINKIATLRNSRGNDVPNVIKVAQDVERFGAQGITVHPRPDERHIKYQDVLDLSKIVKTEFNVEGNPVDRFMELVLRTKPTQVTLVPDAEDAITSNAGWNTIKNKDFLFEITSELRRNNIRTSIFVDPQVEMVEAAANTGTDRIELYTEAYAYHFSKNKNEAIKAYLASAEVAQKVGLGVNAGHDLSLENIQFFKQNIPNLLEVSIGHALIAEALYEGLETVIKKYLNFLKKKK